MFLYSRTFFNHTVLRYSILAAPLSLACVVEADVDPYEIEESEWLDEHEASLVDSSEPLEVLPSFEDFDESLGDEFDYQAAERQPHGQCISCYTAQTSFRCSGLGWENACYFDEIPIRVTEDCAYCDEFICSTFPVVGNVNANPTQVQVFGNTGCTSISWESCRDSQVWVSHNGAPETLFSSGVSGTQSACWIQPGHTYDFCLYEGAEHSNQLDCVTVVGVDGGEPPDPCASCPNGQSCRCEPDMCYPDHLPCQ